MYLIADGIALEFSIYELIGKITSSADTFKEFEGAMSNLSISYFAHEFWVFK